MHTFGLLPVQVPLTQRSVCVQPFPSLHVPFSLAFAYVHTPVAGAHTPAAWHTSGAAQAVSHGCRILHKLRSWIDHELDRWGQELGSSWAITRDGSLLGRLGIGGVSLEEARAGVTYWVLPEARRRGVARLALGAVADWAFVTAGFHRLELDHSTQNPASCRVATKAGFAPEGTLRGRALHRDGWHDMHKHGLLADDARPGSPAA